MAAYSNIEHDLALYTTLLKMDYPKILSELEPARDHALLMFENECDSVRKSKYQKKYLKLKETVERTQALLQARDNMKDAMVETAKRLMPNHYEFQRELEMYSDIASKDLEGLITQALPNCERAFRAFSTESNAERKAETKALYDKLKDGIEATRAMIVFRDRLKASMINAAKQSQ